MVRMRLVLAALALAACGSEPDERPATLQFITENILKPACANAECHSSFKNEEGYSFSTVAEARRTFQSDPTLSDLDNINSDQQALILNLTQETESAPRMPYDQPLPNADIALISAWLDQGLPGICSPGKTTACLGEKTVVPCSGDAYDVGHLVKTMCDGTSMCVDGACQ